jgi:hypothetical protein
MGLPDGTTTSRSRWLALAVLCAVTMMIILDSTTDYNRWAESAL